MGRGGGGKKYLSELMSCRNGCKQALNSAPGVASGVETCSHSLSYRLARLANCVRLVGQRRKRLFSLFLPKFATMNVDNIPPYFKKQNAVLTSSMKSRCNVSQRRRSAEIRDETSCRKKIVPLDFLRKL